MFEQLVLELYIVANESTMANLIRLMEQTKGCGHLRQMARSFVGLEFIIEVQWPVQ